MKRGGGLLPARPDCWPPTKRPRATPGGLIAASVTCLSRREGVPPCLRTSPPLGGTLWGSPDFLAYPVPKACMHVPGTRVPRRLGDSRPHPIPERLFNRVTSDFFYLGELDDEECHWTSKKVNGVLLIQCRHSGYIQVLPCNIESMTGKAAAKWCAQTWMGGWDVPSEVVTDSGKEYTSEWWKELCARLGIHHLRCEIHSHRALPGERAGRSIINMLRKELASEKDFHWLEVLFALLRRYHNTPLYHGLSPNEIVFGRKKCWWNMPLNNRRPCKDASLFLDEIQRAEKTVSKLIDKHQADWLWVQNQGRKNPHNFEVDDRV